MSFFLIVCNFYLRSQPSTNSLAVENYNKGVEYSNAKNYELALSFIPDASKPIPTI
jgi:hypothetical protein